MTTKTRVEKRVELPWVMDVDAEEAREYLLAGLRKEDCVWLSL